MGFIRTYVANSNELFSDEELDLIKGAGQKVESYVNQHFDFDYNVDLIVTTPSLTFPVIPEDGVGGKTCSSRLIVLAIDREAFDFNEAFLLETIAHEMAHSLRWEKVSEYAETLIDGGDFRRISNCFRRKSLGGSWD